MLAKLTCVLSPLRSKLEHDSRSLCLGLFGTNPDWLSQNHLADLLFYYDIKYAVDRVIAMKCEFEK